MNAQYIKYSEVNTALRFWPIKNSSKEFTFPASGAIERRRIFVFNLFIWFQVSRNLMADKTMFLLNNKGLWKMNEFLQS